LPIELDDVGSFRIGAIRIELRDHRGRRSGRREDAEPRTDLESGRVASDTVGNSGIDDDRLSVVTAGPRSFACANVGGDAAMPSKIIATLTAHHVAHGRRVPLYGTWVIDTPPSTEQLAGEVRSWPAPPGRT
jgi:hypothetical protein